MRFGKKQLVMASLVLALGAAVYLNWQFSGVKKLPVSGEVSSPSQTVAGDKKLGAAQLVNSVYVETVSDDLEERAPAVAAQPVKDVFAQARVQRQTSRDQALELLDEVLENAQSDPEAKKAAVDEAAVIARSILQETNVENMLKAKGFEECMATLSADGCSVMVSGTLDAAATLIIQETVMEQTGVTADKIRILGTA